MFSDAVLLNKFLLFLFFFILCSSLVALKAALRSKCPDADESLWVTTEGKTRICTTLVSADSGEATEIVEVLHFFC